MTITKDGIEVPYSEDSILDITINHRTAFECYSVSKVDNGKDIIYLIWHIFSVEYEGTDTNLLYTTTMEITNITLTKNKENLIVDLKDGTQLNITL